MTAIGLQTDGSRDFGRWYRSWMLGAVVFWPLLYYLLFHLSLSIPGHLLYLPAAVNIVVSILIGPLMFEARAQFRRSKRRDFRMFYVVLALFNLCTAMTWAYFGMRAGLIPAGHSVALYTIVVLGSVLGPFGAYYLRKLTFRKPAS